MSDFFSILRKPDMVLGATENSPYRFEERANFQECPIKHEFIIEKEKMSVKVYPSDSPVKYLKLRFNGDLEFVEKIMGDGWERVSGYVPIGFSSVRNSIVMPNFFYAIGNNKTACYGVKTGGDSFVSFYLDRKGITVFIDLTCGSFGTDLKEPIIACEIVEHFGKEGQNTFNVCKDFAKKLCDNPVLPKEPVFGVNNWYWAYGNISEEIVLNETEYLLKVTNGVKHSPYMIIDDGWQTARGNGYIGGPWEPNPEKFPDMKGLVDKIHAKNVKAGIWFRPLLTKENFPEEMFLRNYDEGRVLDPSHPKTLEYVESVAKNIRSWGFDLIKHDFSTFDIVGGTVLGSLPSKDFFANETKFYDKTKTTATIIKDFYKAIQKGAGDALVIGCNTVSHLVSGVHAILRTGDDTSGRCFEWSVRNGLNSMMRLPLNNALYQCDPDCAAFTEKVNIQQNIDYLEMCAITGSTTLASITPNILTEEELKKVNEIFKIADSRTEFYTIKNFDKNSSPDIYIAPDGKTERRFDYIDEYNGNRIILNWFE